MFLYKAIYRAHHLMPVRNFQQFTKLQHSARMSIGNLSAPRAQFKTYAPLRFRSGRPGDKIEKELAIEVNQTIKATGLVRPFLFTIGVSSASLVGATIWEYEFVRDQVKKMMSSTITYFNHRQKHISDLSGAWNRITEGYLKQAWDRLSPGDRFFIPICGLNLLVFGLWRIPRLQTMLLKNFCANPAGQAPCRSMLLSTFSHYSFFHIFANMYVLNSFSNGICNALGKEQALALYLSAGCFASFASYVHKVVAGIGGSSLGAEPFSEFWDMFLPMFQFSADSAIKVLMAVDIAGCFMGWRFFDHAAHLGGALFGIFWCFVGEKYIWPKRKIITEKWHDFRSKTCD